MKITDWPMEERPREKLLHLGAAALSDAELLAIFLRTGVRGRSAVDLARFMLNHFGSLRNMLTCQQRDFCKVHGLGRAKYIQLQAVLELSRRYFAEKMERGNALTSAQDTRVFLISQLRDLDREVFSVLLLDNKHRVIQFLPMFYGTIDSAVVHPRELVKIVLEYNAAAVILAHNHPSGVAEPSLSDIQITQKINDVMALIDVRVLDHFVVGDGEAVSFAERGLL